MGQSKGMNIEELRAALASTATRQAERLEKENAALKAEIKKLNYEIEKRKFICKAMFNRCLALTRGLTCMFCGHSEMCEEERTADKPVERAEDETT